jgi:hypothetical protein
MAKCGYLAFESVILSVEIKFYALALILLKYYRPISLDPEMYINVFMLMFIFYNKGALTSDEEPRQSNLIFQA